MTIYQRVIKASKENKGLFLTPVGIEELAGVMRALVKYKRTHNANITQKKKKYS
jgi:hypothetical protein